MARTRSTKQTTQKPSAPKEPTPDNPPRESERADSITGGTAKRDGPSLRGSTNARQTMSTAEEESSYSEDMSTHRRIAVRAFILYLESGCRHGNDLEHWFEAEREVKMQ
ncbi:MAG: DUF2934 domain-containing protein [Nitrospira sp.]